MLLKNGKQMDDLRAAGAINPRLLQRIPQLRRR